MFKFSQYELISSVYQKVSEEKIGKYTYTIFAIENGRYGTLKSSEKGVKKSPFYGWKTLQEAQKWIKEAKESQEREDNYRKELKEAAKDGAKKFLESLKVGDILSGTWGYEATWHEFYKVVGKQGSFVLLQEMKKKVTDDEPQYGWASHGVVTCGDEPASDEILKRKCGDGFVKICSYIYAHRWDGKAREEANWH